MITALPAGIGAGIAAGGGWTALTVGGAPGGLLLAGSMAAAAGLGLVAATPSPTRVPLALGLEQISLDVDEEPTDVEGAPVPVEAG